MKRQTLLLVAVAVLVVVPTVSFFAQSGVPAIAYDAVDFLKPPANMPIGEVAGVATNSKGHVFIYHRSGTVNTTAGTSRTFPHGSSRLMEFDQNGKFVKEIGRDIYAFVYAQAVRIDPQDNIWIVDQYGNMAVKFDPEGRVLMTFGRRPETSRTPNVTFAAVAAPSGAAPAGAGGGAGRGAGAPGGAVPPVPGAQAGGGRGTAGAAPAGGRGAAPAAGGGGGASAGAAGDSFQRPMDVAWDAAGNIFIADGFQGNTPRILKMDKNGRFLKTFGGRGSEPGQFNSAASIAVDAKGNVYVADKGNNRIQVLDNDGNPKAQYTNVGTPAAICVSPGAHQYLYSSNSNDPDDLEHGEIYKMELDGTVLGKFGTAGHLVKEFGSVNSIDCRTENVLYFGELINWRVQKVTLKK